MLKFFEPGHTFMSADSFHAKVEKKMREQENVYDFNEFEEVINSVGINCPMKATDFCDVIRGVSTAAHTSKTLLSKLM